MQIGDNVVWSSQAKTINPYKNFMGEGQRVVVSLNPIRIVTTVDVLTYPDIFKHNFRTISKVSDKELNTCFEKLSKYLVQQEILRNQPPTSATLSVKHLGVNKMKIGDIVSPIDGVHLVKRHDDVETFYNLCVVVHINPLVVVGGINDKTGACFYGKTNDDFYSMGTASAAYLNWVTEFFNSVEIGIGDVVISQKLISIQESNPTTGFGELGLGEPMIVISLKPFTVLTLHGTFTFNDAEISNFKVVEKNKFYKTLKRFGKNYIKIPSTFLKDKTSIIASPKEPKEQFLSGHLNDIKINGFGVGDVVVPKTGVYLRSGASYYTAAVVVSVIPFVIVSLEGDMRWGSMDPNEFVFNHKASKETLEISMTRIDN